MQGVTPGRGNHYYHLALYLNRRKKMSGEDMLKMTTDELEKLLTPAHIIGAPLDLGDKLVIPVTEFGFGFGAGSGQSGEKGAGGAGSGGGGGISPVALIVIHKNVPGVEGIQVLSLRKESTIVRVISTIAESLAPQAISAMKDMGKKKEEK
jgi:uncharacterized spore protein YtfJ